MSDKSRGVHDFDDAFEIQWADSEPFIDLRDSVRLTQPALAAANTTTKSRRKVLGLVLAVAALAGITTAVAISQSETVIAQSSLAEQTTTLVQPSSTRDQPLAFDTEMAVSWDRPGEELPTVWNLMVSPLHDMTNEVLASDVRLTRAPAGMVFAGFDVEMTLIETDTSLNELPAKSQILWDVIGGVSGEVFNNEGQFDHPCGNFADELLRNAMYEGGSTSGTQCIVIPEADLDHPETVIAARDRVRAYFGEDGASAIARAVPILEEPMEISSRDGDRSKPFEFDTETTIDFGGHGDSEESIWTVEFSAPADITDEVVDGMVDGFDASLRDGFVFAGVDVTVTLETASVAQKSLSPYVLIQIFGGASGVVYEPHSLPNGCGPIIGQFFRGNEVPVGGSSSGQLCMQIRNEDVGHPNTRVALEFFDGSRVFFG